MAGDSVRLRQFIDREPNLPPGIIHHQGKDVRGYYPGQIARVHFKYPTESKPGPFTKLLPVPVKHEVVVPVHEFDHLVLKRYIQYQKTKKKCIDWYTQTTYRDAYGLPFYIYKTDDEDYGRMTDAEILAIWKSTPAMKRTAVKPSYMGV